MVKQLTIQIHYEHTWHDAAIIEFPEALDSSECALDYQFEHVLDHFNDFAETAVSIRLPNETMVYRQTRNWFRFLDDIMPAGSSYQYWVTRLQLEGLDWRQRNFALLSQGTIAPIGNVRIKEAVPALREHIIPVTFSIEDVCIREVDFIEYAQEQGAAAGGASGAGGAAPKLLVRVTDNEQVWIDTFQDNPRNLDQRYLVKFARGNSDIDKDILRAEYHFYHELTAMGFDTIPTDNMRLEESFRGPSLWLPRFDVVHHDGKEVLLGMESVYSMLDLAPATPMYHGDVIRQLIATITQEVIGTQTRTLLDEDDGIAQFVIEWVRRDLLCIAFCNSDNHGRNTAFIKQDNMIRLAPIYDFAPMKADPEVISRTFTWGAGMENGGEYDFQRIADSLSDLVDPTSLLSALRMTAEALTELPVNLVRRGVPESVMTHPSIHYSNLTNKLTRWGLL